MKSIHGGDIYTHEGVIDFSANINPLGVKQGVLEAAKLGLEKIANYPDVSCRALRQAIGQKEGVMPNEVICGNGAAELIFNIVMAVRPKRALLLAPSFGEYEQALSTIGTEIVYYKLQEAYDFALREDYLEALTQDIDMIFLCNPNNPTGKTIGQDLLEEIIKVCEAKRIFVVVDECFNDFLENSPQHSVKAMLKNHPHLFILKAFTKMYAMAGLRLGYGLCSNAELLQKMYRLRQPWSVSIPAQEAGIAALEEVDLPEETRQYIKVQRDYLCHQLKRLGIIYFKPEANYIFFKGPVNLKTTLLAHNILIRDCSNYIGLEQGYYRIAVKTKSDNEKLIKALESIME